MKDKATKMRHIDRCDWDRFCQQYKKTEKGMKSFLFKEKLSEKEFETLIDCSRHTFTDFVYYIDYGKLFTSCPRLIECCNWTRLDELSWMVLLSQMPEFADKCNKWDEFDGDDWSCLLAKQPQFADKCNWDSLKGFDWSRLLVKQPQFADKCAWDKFDGWAWRMLLENQPQFVNKCDKWDEFYGNDWSCLLAKQPQFADKCDWDKLDGSYWGYLLSEQPQFADKCNWDSLEGFDWSCLLAKQPQFADKCDWDKLDGSAWRYLLSERPQFADKCDVWDYLDAVQWRSLLKHQPQLVDKCAKSSIVVNVLIKHPQFTEHCNTSIITEKGKAKLLAKHPDLVKYFPKKTETKVPKKKQIKNKLVALLLENENAEVSKQPQFADKCNKWDEFNENEKEELIDAHPNLAKYFK